MVPASVQPDNTEPPAARALERLFSDVYVPIMLWKGRAVSVVLVLLLFAYAIFSTVFALKMEPPIKKEEWFPSSHMLTRVQESSVGFFG